MPKLPYVLPWILPALFSVGAFAPATSFSAVDSAPFADVHLHYNWDHEEVTSPREAAESLAANNVALGVVSGVPAPRARELQEAADFPVIALFSPYIHHRGRMDWFRDSEVVARTREALASGRFHGIGEVHFVASVGPPWDSPVFQGLLDLAREFDVPVLIHAESSDPEYFRPVCEANPEVRFQWAHAGSRLGPEEVGELMESCPNVWTELSARDPWRYGRFAAEDGELDEAWVRLFKRFPDRFMTGSDPVWPPGSSMRWDQADSGWERVGQFLDYHRAWLAQLPPELARKIRLTNALDFYAHALQEDGNL